jgi:hypothetical protein
MCDDSRESTPANRRAIDLGTFVRNSRATAIPLALDVLSLALHAGHDATSPPRGRPRALQVLWRTCLDQSPLHAHCQRAPSSGADRHVTQARARTRHCQRASLESTGAWPPPMIARACRTEARPCRPSRLPGRRSLEGHPAKAGPLRSIVTFSRREAL